MKNQRLVGCPLCGNEEFDGTECMEYGLDTSVEKDYEILSLTSIESSTRNEKVLWYFDKENNGWTVDEPERAYYKDIPDFTKIHSIKRLSDFEIFTVGDKNEDGDKYLKIELYTHKNDTIKNQQVWLSINEEVGVDLHSAKKLKQSSFTTEDGVSISEETKVFWVMEDKGIWVKSYNSLKYFDSSVKSGKWKVFSSRKSRQEWLKKMYPKPLFTTKDNIDLFQGDIIYYVSTSDWEVNKDIVGNFKHSTKEHPVEHWYKDDKYFSTKEAAEEYILYNKPCLSLNDVYKLCHKTGVNNLSKTFNTRALKTLVKSKL